MGGSTFVIGDGIPASWCSQPMKVQGVVTKAGRVDWSWDGKAMQVKIRGKRSPVRLGPNFPKNAAVQVEYGKE
jgi:hypothetical protein